MAFYRRENFGYTVEGKNIPKVFIFLSSFSQSSATTFRDNFKVIAIVLFRFSVTKIITIIKSSKFLHFTLQELTNSLLHCTVHTYQFNFLYSEHINHVKHINLSSLCLYFSYCKLCRVNTTSTSIWLKGQSLRKVYKKEIN